MTKILQHTVSSRSSLLEPQTAEQLVAVPVIERVVVARGGGAGGLAWCHTAGRLMHVHDTGWSDTASPGRYTNTGHRRLRDHALQVPAVADQQWMVPLFSSSTEWWILPLC